ncbi:hypothetical protein GGTG_02381 [Gaeumannomyces tritici R3-111a-1]|uniref:Uncharacterized protein n=1 Tax=Gaeumannomyces tritici (strain R3-111a-1) TaxID=644352 RepID=J3NM77_GAET3|nr:hypothetical protein GGTG_02381 [Gaeumannomyces tritici R3-111a-1]EJT82408.1 hypothetical protein GGTG_02381 [Gaeumannomyces tritici R3-111a-1]
MSYSDGESLAGTAHDSVPVLATCFSSAFPPVTPPTADVSSHNRRRSSPPTHLVFVMVNAADMAVPDGTRQTGHPPETEEEAHAGSWKPLPGRQDTLACRDHRTPHSATVAEEHGDDAGVVSPTLAASHTVLGAISAVLIFPIFDPVAGRVSLVSRLIRAATLGSMRAPKREMGEARLDR